MKNRLATALLACLPMVAAAAPQTYVLDPFHSYPNFSVNHLGMSTLHGRFDKMNGRIVLDQSAKTGSLEVKIPTASINTGDGKRADGTRSRDEHLRSADFFNSAEFPDMVYKSSKFNFTGDTLESIDGTLTLLGVSKPVRLTVTQFKCGTHPFSKKTMCGADAAATIKRSDFGIKFGLPSIGDEVRLSLAVEAFLE